MRDTSQIRLTSEGRQLLARLKIVNARRTLLGEKPLVAGKLAEDGLRPTIEAEERRLGIEPQEGGQDGDADI